MVNVDAGGGDRLALAVLAQYRMATTEQMHLLLAPGVRVEQTRWRLVKLRGEGLIDCVTLPQAGRMRVWFATQYGAQIACEWPELRGWQPSRTGSDRTAARLRVGHALTVTATALAFVQDARRRGDVCRPLDWVPEVYHPLGSGEALIPDALLYYRRGCEDGDGGSMLRAFVEVDRADHEPFFRRHGVASLVEIHHSGSASWQEAVTEPPPVPGRPAITYASLRAAMARCSAMRVASVNRLLRGSSGPCLPRRSWADPQERGRAWRR